MHSLPFFKLVADNSRVSRGPKWLDRGLTTVLVVFDWCFPFDEESTFHIYIVRPESSAVNSGDEDMTAYVVQADLEKDKVMAGQQK